MPKDNVEFLAYGCSKKDLEAACSRLTKKGFGVAGIIVEPLQGRGGVVLPPKGWLQTLREVATAVKGLLIFDEIFTGLGRTGSLLASSQVQGDLVCLGKALGGGMPISACIGTNEVFASWPICRGEALHTGTFFGHGLSCSVGLLTLELLCKENLPERSCHLGLEAKEYLEKKLATHPLVKQIRGKGLMLAVEFKKDNIGAKLMGALRKKGVVVLPSGPRAQVLSLTPALNIPKNLLFRSIDLIAQTLTEEFFGDMQ